MLSGALEINKFIKGKGRGRKNGGMGERKKDRLKGREVKELGKNKRERKERKERKWRK